MGSALPAREERRRDSSERRGIFFISDETQERDFEMAWRED
jgi:hypothetical protein